jgi:hypothetical protein
MWVLNMLLKQEVVLEQHCKNNFVSGADEKDVWSPVVTLMNILKDKF